MLVKKQQVLLNLAIFFTIAFLALYLVVLIAPNSLHDLNRNIYELTTKEITSEKVLFFNVISALSSTRMALIYTGILAIVLFFIRWQIPGMWVTFTVIIGLVLGGIIRFTIRSLFSHRVEPEIGYAFPGLHVLGMVILSAIVFLIFLPYFKDRALAYLTGFILLVWLIETSIACIYLGQLHLSDVIGAVLFGFSWVMFSSFLYRKHAQKLKQYPKFKFSNI